MFELIVPAVAVGILIDCHCVVDWVISATRELVCEDERVEFRPPSLEGMELHL